MRYNQGEDLYMKNKKVIKQSSSNKKSAIDTNNIINQVKQALPYIIFAVLMGSLVYFTMMANNLVNNIDGIWHPSNFIAGNWEISLGRGLLRYVDRARFGIVSTAWNSILVFGIIGLADALLIRFFKLEKTVFAYILIFLSIVNPVISESLTYSFTSVDYALAFLFVVSSFILISMDKNIKVWRIALSILFFGISMALYQAYICVFAVLVLYYCIVKLNNKYSIKEVLIQCGKSAGVFVGGGVCYYIITKLLLWRAGVGLADYKGAGNVSVGSIFVNIPNSFVNSYKEFFRYVVTNRMNIKVEFAGIMLILLGLVILGLMIYGLVKTKKINMILIIPIFLIMPMAACIICFIAVGNSISGIMAMGIVMSLVMFYTFIKDYKIPVIIFNATLLMLAWFMVNTVVNDQIALKEGTVATTTIAQNVMADIYSDNLLEEAEAVAFVGRTYDNPTFYKSSAYENANGYAQFGKWSTDAWNNRTTWIGITESLCGVEVPVCDEAKYSEILNSGQADGMPSYPKEGYMRVVDGVIVVKISDTIR